MLLFFTGLEVGRHKLRNYIKENGHEVTGYVTGLNSRNIHVAYSVYGKRYEVTVPNAGTNLVAGDSCKLKYIGLYFKDVVLISD